MNIKKIQFINELMTEQMNHWLLFPLILTVMGIGRAVAGTGEPSVLMWAMCSLIPPVFFLFRCKIKNLILFVLAHLAIIALVFLLAGQSFLGRIVCTICVIGYMLHSLVLRLKYDTVYSDGLSLPFGIGLAAVASLFQYYQGTRGWESYYHVALIVSIALYFIIYYIEHYLDFLSANKSSAGFLPAAEMFHSGIGLVLIYTLLGMGVLLFSTQFEWLSGILRPIKNLLLQFLRFIFSHSAQLDDDDVIPVETPASTEGMGDMALAEESEPFWLWKVLQYITIIILVVAAFWLVFKLLWKLFKLIQKYMSFQYRERAIQTGEEFDLREKCEIEKDTQRKSQGLFSALSPRERVRRLYKKKLAAAAARMEPGDRDSLEFHTAREWERRLSLDGMADLYEQARYSDREITSTDVKKMKDAWK